jgi:uncharacterized repeat protein (TIGR01451 family)
MAAHAAGTLIIGPVPASTPIDILANVTNEFPGATYINANAAGAVTASTFAPNYDLVVLVQPVSASTPYDVPNMDPGNLAAVMTAIQNRSATAFAIFADSGGTGRPAPYAAPNTTSTTDLIARLNTISGWGIGISATNPHLGNDADQLLNSNSPFNTGFNATIRGGFFHHLNNVPALNALYVNTLPLANPTALQDGVYGVLIPSVQSYGGTGACVMAFSDLTIFEDRAYLATNATKIGPLIIAAAGAAGACSMAVDLVPTISGPSAPTVGAPAPYTVVVTNQGALTSTNGTVVITLPPNLVLAPSVPAGCIRNSDTQMTCDLAVLAPAGLATGGSVSIPFSATPNSVAPGASISVGVSGVTNESNTTNNSTQMPITGGTNATAVPTLSHYGLVLLVLSMLGLVASRLRRPTATAKQSRKS